jgi:hypothetical protein
VDEKDLDEFSEKLGFAKGQASPESLLRAAPQGNHRQAKILTPRSSGFA